jgi:prepilin-type N-terminal cleavage/methylation domain-containing protein
MNTSKRRENAGYTLIELAIVLVLMGLVFAAIVVSIPAFIYQQNSRTTEKRFDVVLNTLSAYTQSHYRLPCPADPDGARRGLERDPNGHCFRNTSARNLYEQTEGVVPWRTLGLAETDVMDGWGNYFTYRPAPQLTVMTSDTDMQVADGASNAEIHNACRNAK